MTATSDWRRGRYARALTAALCGLAGLGALAQPARGCTVPVFQYALARWEAGAYRVVICHRGALAPEAKRLAGRLFAAQRSGEANITVRTVDLAREPGAGENEALGGQAAGKLPSMIVYYPASAKIKRPAFAGPLTAATTTALTDSPVRRELVRRLIAGHAGVWLLLESGRRDTDDAAAKSLAQQLAESGKTLKLPVPPDAPASSRRQISVEFSMVRVSRSDPAERVLTALLVGSQADLPKSAEPMAFCVFGRGRALPALVGKEISAREIRDCCALVTGMCACVVKSANRGVDLLLGARWEGAVGPQRRIGPKAQPLVGEAYDPAELRLKVAKMTITAPGVAKQCRGTFVVRNVGPAFQTPPHVIGPSYGVFIHDASGRLLFRNFGGWGPGMKAGGQITLRWDTHSNHLGGTSEPPFLIPAPGRYTLKIVLYARTRSQILDVSTVAFEVKPAS